MVPPCSAFSPTVETTDPDSPTTAMLDQFRQDLQALPALLQSSAPPTVSPTGSQPNTVTPIENTTDPSVQKPSSPDPEHGTTPSSPLPSADGDDHWRLRP
jgi:hypothetical protein